MSGGRQTSLLTQGGTAPVHLLVLQAGRGGVRLETGELVVLVYADGGLILFKLVCISPTFLSPDFLESVPGERAAGALEAEAAVQWFSLTSTNSTTELLTVGVWIFLVLIELTFRTVGSIEAGLVWSQPAHVNNFTPRSDTFLWRYKT